jgi:hypothetical protein
MEIGFIIATILLALFGVLGIFDGLYLHLIKYRLYAHKESRFEHLTHTFRAVLFPAILYFLYLCEDTVSFFIGLTVVLLDLLITGIDAYVEKDSRSFMGGLPRWEYIIHLAVNGVHFASVAVFLILKLEVTAKGIAFRTGMELVAGYDEFTWLVRNLIPGGIVIGLLHILVVFPGGSRTWEKLIRHRA